MIKTAKGRIRKFIKEKFEYKVNPSGIFRAKITKELDYEPDSYKMNGSLKLKCKCGDVLYTPLDGILVYIILDKELYRLNTDIYSLIIK